MRSLLVIAALSLSAVSFGQCVKCNSLEEAGKDPLNVKSIIINPNVGDGEVLDQIPVTIKQFSNLEVLMLSDHGLMSIPKEIGSLTKLKILGLAGNSLEELPEEIYTMKQLKELILLDNAFSDEYLEELQEKVKKHMPGTRLITD